MKTMGLKCCYGDGVERGCGEFYMALETVGVEKRAGRGAVGSNSNR